MSIIVAALGKLLCLQLHAHVNFDTATSPPCYRPFLFLLVITLLWTNLVYPLPLIEQIAGAGLSSSSIPFQ